MKLRLNDDGTITLPLIVPTDLPEDAVVNTEVSLPEPSLAQLARAMTWVSEADAALSTLAPVETLPDDPTPEQITAAGDALRARSMALYSADAPYAMAVVKIVRDLTGQELSVEQLPGWAASPQVTRELLSHWQSPLGGPASPTTET